MKKKILFLLILVLCVAAFWIMFKFFTPAENNKSFNSLSYKDSTYIVDDQKVELVNGLSVQKIPDSLSAVTTSYFGNEARGDVNEDGKEDIAFLLTQTGGGTGTFYFLAVALKRDNGYQGINSIFLGDRIAPQNTEIKNGIITVNYADRLPDQSFDEDPSVGVSRNFKVVNNILEEVK